MGFNVSAVRIEAHQASSAMIIWDGLYNDVGNLNGKSVFQKQRGTHHANCKPFDDQNFFIYNDGSKWLFGYQDPRTDATTFKPIYELQGEMPQTSKYEPNKKWLKKRESKGLWAATPCPGHEAMGK